MIRHLLLVPALLGLASGIRAQSTFFVDESCSMPGSGTAADPFCLIQDALDVALDGDTVLVGPGTYTENLVFRGFDVALLSTGGPDVTVIDGGGAQTVVRIEMGEGPGARIEGFTIRNGNVSPIGDGGGLFVMDASPTITGNVIEDCGASSGAGIYASGGSPSISDNIVRGCSSSFGGAIQFEGASTGTCSNNSIVDNLSEGVRTERADALILDNDIRRNSDYGIECGFSSAVVRGNVVAENRNAGIYVRGASQALVEGNLVQDNLGSFVGGVYLFAAGNPIVRGNVIRNNRPGGIELVNRSDALIEGNLIVDNDGGGIEWLVPGSGTGPVVRFNTIVGNNRAQGSGIHAEGFDGGALAECNVIVALPGQSAIHCDPSFNPDLPTFRYNDAFSNGGASWSGACSDLTGIDGNVAADPLFVDEAGGDYRLARFSPVIDAGDPAMLPSGLDLAGGVRLTDGDLDRVPVVDLGAFEYAHVELLLQGPLVAGSSASIQLRGLETFVGFLWIGTHTSTTTYLPLLGYLQFSLSAPFVLTGPLGGLSATARVEIPAAFPVGATVALQALAVGSGADPGGLSGPVLAVVQAPAAAPRARQARGRSLDRAALPRGGAPQPLADDRPLDAPGRRAAIGTR